MPYIKDIIGVGLARGIPNWKGGRASHTSFAPIFKKCKDMGLHLTAHAGMYTTMELHALAYACTDSHRSSRQLVTISLNTCPAPRVRYVWVALLCELLF